MSGQKWMGPDGVVRPLVTGVLHLNNRLQMKAPEVYSGGTALQVGEVLLKGISKITIQHDPDALPLVTLEISGAWIDIRSYNAGDPSAQDELPPEAT